MGFFDYIILPFGYLMQFCCWVFPNYLAALALFTVLIQLLLCLIFGIKQQKNSLKQAALAPKVAALRDKYAGRTDQQTRLKLQEETQQLYQENGFNPAGGCLPMLIQLPIILALYQVIIKPLRFILGICRFDGEGFKAVLQNFADKGIISATQNGVLDTTANQYEILRWLNANHGSAEAGELLNGQTLSLTKVPTFSFGGFDMSQAPQIASLLVLVPVLIFITMVLSQLITRRFTYQDPAMKEQQNNLSMKIMTYSMPLLSVYISFQLPAAVGIYWIYRSIAATIQQMILYKLMPPPKFTEEDYEKARQELKGTSKKKKKKSASEDGSEQGSTRVKTGDRPRSLHHIDDEDEELPPAPKKKQAELPEKVAAEDASDAVVDTAEDSAPAPVQHTELNGAPVLKDDKGNKRYKKK